MELFEDAGYRVEITALDSSHQNGPVERPHQTIADALRAMLGRANLEPKFWPCAFHRFIRLYNVILHIMSFDALLANLDVRLRPFTDKTTVTVPLDLAVSVEPLCLKSSVEPSPSTVLRAFKRGFLGAYVVSIDNHPVFTATNIYKALDVLRKCEAAPNTVEIILAPERRSNLRERPSPLHLVRMHVLRRICALQ